MRTRGPIQGEIWCYSLLKHLPILIRCSSRAWLENLNYTDLSMFAVQDRSSVRADIC